jgi:hypothetical protein
MMSYTNISRTELETWLNAKNYSWTRDLDKQGIYFIVLSPKVAIKLSSTQTKNDNCVTKGFASMNLTLVSRVNGWTLNRKARDRKHFKRTTNWKTTWAEGISHWKKEYMSKHTFYEKIADRDLYKTKWMSAISSSPRFQSDARLKLLHAKLSQGEILWDNEEASILSSI